MSDTPRYDSERGDHRLTDFSESPVDDDLRRAFGSSGVQPKRPGNTASETLILFARRSALRALREGDSSWCASGLRALAGADPRVVDVRDITWAAALIRHAADTLSASTRELFAAAAAEAPAETSSIFADLPDRKESLADWGYRQIATERGVELMPWSYHAFDPRHDLVAAAIEASRLIDADRYSAGDPQCGVALPPVWFRSSARLNGRLNALRGVVSASGALVMEEPPSQLHRILVFIAEAPNARHAAWIAARPATAVSGRHVLGAAEGPLLAMIVGGSWTVGEVGVESKTSLGRFRDGLERILRTCRGSDR